MQISMWFAALAFHRMNNNGEVRFGWLVFTLHIDVAVAELTTKSTNFYGRTKVDIFLILRIFFCFFIFPPFRCFHSLSLHLVRFMLVTNVIKHSLGLETCD